MIWILTFALVLGLVFALMRKRWSQSTATETEKMTDLPVPEGLADSRRSKYKVTNLQNGLDQDPDD